MPTAARWLVFGLGGILALSAVSALPRLRAQEPAHVRFRASLDVMDGLFFAFATLGAALGNTFLMVIACVVLGTGVVVRATHYVRARRKARRGIPTDCGCGRRPNATAD
ncbi:hypothetical protein ABT034_30765 [Streptomyces sp. NPDC002773]|uniref:hypothetical protein n=1 Tax=Streptomyces sp. NPDC002773 TaxID=3154430 RepID=UPI00332FEB86